MKKRLALATAFLLAAAMPPAVACAAQPVSITISAAGDCTLGTDSHFAYSSSLPAMYKAKGSAYFLKKVKKVFAKDDLSIVNLEGTLTVRGSRASKTFAFKGSPKYTAILKKGSVEAVTFANNHAYDYGTVSHKNTIAHVSAAGIKISSYSRVSYCTTKGVKVGMVAVNDIEGSGNAKSLIKSGVKKARKHGATIVTVSIHAGIEKQYTPTSRQKELAHYAVRCGADLVIGHHPHVLGGVEKYKGVYIAYSLGNFCFGGNTRPFDMDTMILQKTFTVKNGKVVKDKALKVIPCSISGHTSYNDYQPRVLSGSAKKRVMAKINRYSKPLGVKFAANGKAK